jgi:murein DD-endopeptidase MepM/ murein hydrolase activator NlpD
MDKGLKPFVLVGLSVLFLVGLAAFAPVSAPLRAQDMAATPEGTATPVPKPDPATTLQGGAATLELDFQSIPQGRFGVMHVSGPGVSGARARFLDTIIEFFPIANDGFYGLLAVNMEQTPRAYDLPVEVRFADGSSVTIGAQAQVVLGNFIKETFVLPPDRAYLADPQIERAEYARLDGYVGVYTPEKLWGDAGFQKPINSVFTAPFGSFRLMNNSMQTRHTGWDLRAAVGTPVMAMASGKVAFAGLLDIRGNYVLIDHGYGLFSGYAHMSQIHVTRGQSVSKGQIIGVSGNTGRSNGPHVHWEIIINGVWIDSVQFMSTWMP